MVIYEPSRSPFSSPSRLIDLADCRGRVTTNLLISAAVLMVLLVLSSGCAGDFTGVSTTASTPAVEPSISASATSQPSSNTAAGIDGATEATEAPDFRFKLFQGEDTLGASELALSELEGRPLVLNFWARFCTPCWSEMPELQKFFLEYEDRIRLVGVDVGQFTGLGSPKDASGLLESLGVTYPAGYTDDSSVVRRYGIRAMPTTVFISSNGRLLRTWSGSITREQLEAIARSDLLIEE